MNYFEIDIFAYKKETIYLFILILNYLFLFCFWLYSLFYYSFIHIFGLIMILLKYLYINLKKKLAFLLIRLFYNRTYL